MKNFSLLLFFYVCLSLFSFESQNHLTKQTYTNPKILGHWQINEISVDNVKYDINKIPNCENKENIEFKDSTCKWETYSFRKNRCFKNVWTGNYKMNMIYDGNSRKLIKILDASHTSIIIIIVNDTMLK